METRFLLVHKKQDETLCLINIAHITTVFINKNGFLSLVLNGYDTPFDIKESFDDVKEYIDILNEKSNKGHFPSTAYIKT